MTQGGEFAHGGPAGSGTIRVQPEDFRVFEATGYAPSGDGEHLWLEIEKRGMNTVDVAQRLARLAGVPVRSVGFAGLKDRNAVTRQPFSIQMPGREDPDWSGWSDEDIRIVSVSRHNRKIQRGRLAGNRFELVVREVEGDRDELEERLQRIAELGVPNGFGEQRFGGNNIARAHRLFRGELRRKPSRAKRGFYLSAARSLIFNQVLQRRILAGTWNRVIDGEIVMLDGTRSTFAADASDPEIQARCKAQDLHPTGPLVGAGDSGVAGAAAALEQGAIDRERELADGLAKFRLQADRRPLRMRVIDLDWEFDGAASLLLRFSLRSGCYATAVLRELLEYRDASHDT
ncbi:MAG: tRNA pseudouridine(13) synthase TruD [Wenzhouxiangellaceae bacterium]|nr:tRNA pseudouridine(13) synthase TruD [Wenzhouxiangellaceae bacterium]MBS3746834.1 tRNA pseudouridine(13) synthase TruD [Wenzhouxiangellaceae bacterium]MBS3823353.1 tRNA pseudouridine(13) synthase TruD [Wenzhouxiangellaceae bacterium]